MNRWLRKAIFYYRHGGISELSFTVLRRVLWSPRSLYRRFRWWQLCQRKTHIYKKIGDIELLLNPKDAGISMELAVDGVHEPLFTHLLSQIVREGMTVVDIGGNIGYYALLEAKWVGPTGKVIVFEPAPETFELLKFNIVHNRMNNIYAYQLAIGEYRQKQIFYIFEQANWNSFTRHAKVREEIIVDVYPLDELLKDESHIDIIRMDIEGYECKAIDGMKEILSRHKPTLCVELHSAFIPFDEIKHFLTTVRQFGYEIRYAIQRIKDEVFWGKVLAAKTIEEFSIDDLLRDERVINSWGHFSLILSVQSINQKQGG